jgi:predicted nucleic acid-binding protein
MILIDSSIWMDHFRQKNSELIDLARGKAILCHPFVVGEIAMSSFAQREIILSDLSDLPQAIVAFDDDVQKFVTRHKLFSLGIGYIDAHLLVSAQLTPGTHFWTKDKRLLAAAEKLGLAMTEPTPLPN